MIPTTYRVQIAAVTVVFDSPLHVVFDFLTDPTRRPAWQASLRCVEDLVPLGTRAGDVGTSWRDVTMVPWVRPRMEVVESEYRRSWVEIGRWGPVDANLTLGFVSAAHRGTEVSATAYLTVPIVFAPALAGLRLVAAPALRADMETAATYLNTPKFTDKEK